MKTCETCGYWQRDGYTFAGAFNEPPLFGDCLYSETEHGDPLYEDTLFVGAGKYGQSFACTHQDFSCPRHNPNAIDFRSSYR
jgi:hypothetical protein